MKSNLLSRMQVVQGDITRMDVDAIVNAAKKNVTVNGSMPMINCELLRDSLPPLDWNPP